LKRHLERDFDGRGAVARKENVFEVARRKVGPIVWRDGAAGVAAHAERCAMGHAVELCADGGIDAG